MLVNILTKLTFGIITGLASLFVSPSYAAQIVAPQNLDAVFASPNQVITSSIQYSVSAPDTDNATGLGLRVHFDSSKLSFNSLSNSLQNGFQAVGDIQDDSNDYDKNARYSYY